MLCLKPPESHASLRACESSFAIKQSAFLNPRSFTNLPSDDLVILTPLSTRTYLTVDGVKHSGPSCYGWSLLTESSSKSSRFLPGPGFFFETRTSKSCTFTIDRNLCHYDLHLHLTNLNLTEL